jgi:hypothetical protein
MVGQGQIGPGGKISATGLQMMKQFMTTYAPMTGTGPGAILGAASAQDIMSFSGMKSLQAVNQAADSVSQIMTGGAAGTAALVQLLGGTPITAKKEGIQVAAAAAPATKAFAKALSSPFTQSGAAAWAAFAGQGGQLPAEEQNLDQLRTAITLGALTSGQSQQLAAYQLMQMLPEARNSPAALANLMSMGAQAGIPGMNYFTGSSQSGANLAKQYAAAAAAISKSAGTRNQATSLTNAEAVKLSNLPALAASLITSQTGASALDTAEVTQAGTQALAIQQAVAAGKPLGGNLSGLVATLMAGQGTKYQPGAIGASLTSILGQEGIGGSKLSGLVQQGKVIYKSEYDKTNPPPAKGVVNFDNHLKPIPAQQGKGTINFDNFLKPVPPQTAAGTVIYKNVLTRPSVPTLSGTIVYHAIISGPGNIAGAGQLGSLGGHTGSGMQHGFKVPGFGGGDTFPAMLEPGELVVPKDMVAGGAVDHLQGKIPGFQSGGFIGVPDFPGLGVGFRVAMEQVAQELLGDMQQALSSIGGSPGGRFGGMQPMGGGGSGGGPVPRGTAGSPVVVHVASVAPAVAASSGGGFAGAPLPASKAAQKIFDAFEKTFKDMPGPWNQVASQILNGLIAGIKNAPKESAAAAQALVNKVKTEIAFGQSVTNAAVSGLNFGGMQVAQPTMTSSGQPYQYYIDQQNIAAGGQPGSVQEQMGSYLQAMQSFQGDMGKLAKGGLQKRLLSQLYAAGPIQGDAEAQSILGGQGGIKAANQLYNQINSLATKLGVSAIGNVYGQPHPALQGKDVKVGVTANAAPVHALQSAINGLHGKTVVIKVQVETGSGSGGSGGGVDLSAAQIKGITSKVQAALLQQAKRNRRTGITLPGYGS